MNPITDIIFSINVISFINFKQKIYITFAWVSQNRARLPCIGSENWLCSVAFIAGRLGWFCLHASCKKPLQHHGAFRNERAPGRLIMFFGSFTLCSGKLQPSLRRPSFNGSLECTVNFHNLISILSTPGALKVLQRALRELHVLLPKPLQRYPDALNYIHSSEPLFWKARDRF